MEFLQINKTWSKPAGPQSEAQLRGLTEYFSWWCTGASEGTKFTPSLFMFGHELIQCHSDIETRPGGAPCAEEMDISGWHRSYGNHPSLPFIWEVGKVGALRHWAFSLLFSLERWGKEASLAHCCWASGTFSCSFTEAADRGSTQWLEPSPQPQEAQCNFMLNASSVERCIHLREKI